MKKFALNFICKNESHVIENMLLSALPVTDMIVALDTGSTDNTIDLIHNFGKQHNLPTWVFERPFDDFASSRTQAMVRLREVARALPEGVENIWGFWIDCDETMIVTDEFDRNSITSDLYYVYCKSGDSSFTKSLFFSLTADLYWEGPIHECFASGDMSLVSSGYTKGISILWEPKGHSWKGDLVKKYENYGAKLEAYVHAGNRRARWLFYTGECFMAAAGYCKNDTLAEPYLKRAKKYFLEAVENNYSKDLMFQDGDVYGSQARLGYIQSKLHPDDWGAIEEQHLKAYAFDNLHAEPFAYLIEHYINGKQFEQLYLFTKFSFLSFHGHNPVEVRPMALFEGLYNWQLLYYHYLACYKTNRNKEAKRMYGRLLQLLQDQPGYFKKEDTKRIYAAFWAWLALGELMDRVGIRKKKHTLIREQPAVA